ncbi:MAG: ribonuclease P protein component [Actinobacteria bacterium]|nr:ribonuclease P protein component [Actinomycetota bacterium]
MLPRHNRIVEPGDFRQVVRRGEKQVTAHLIVYRRPSERVRVGVIVTAKCGNAVVRNTLRRRTRAITRALIDEGRLAGDVIIRFRCEGSVPSFMELKSEIHDAMSGLGRP